MTCPAHNFESDRLPTGADDPCNGSGEGIFESGSYWLYDGSDPALGDCQRLFLRIGDTCGVSEWLEIPLSDIITETRAPIDGVDCCPVGTTWCIPSGTGGTTVDQVWISAGEACGGACASWVKLCGHTFVSATYENTYGPIPDVVFTAYQYDNEISDTLAEYDPVAGTFTAATAKRIMLSAGFQVNYPGFAVTGNVGAHTVMDMSISVLVNGVRVQNIAIDSMLIPSEDGATLRPNWTPNSKGMIVLDLAAGDVVSLEFIHDSNLDPVSLTPGDGLWNELYIVESTC